MNHPAIVLTLNADTPGALRTLLRGLVEEYATAASTTSAPVPAVSAAPAVAQEDADVDDGVRPFRGRNAQAQADAIMARIAEASSAEAVDDVLAGAEPTMKRLPEVRRTEVLRAADAQKAALTPAPAAAVTTTVDAALGGAPPAASAEFLIRDAAGDPMGSATSAAEALRMLESMMLEADSLEEAAAIGRANKPVTEAAALADLAAIQERVQAKFAVAAPGPAAPEPAAPPAGATLEDARSALEWCISTLGFPAAQQRMASLGVQRVTELPNDPASYAAFVAALRA